MSADRLARISHLVEQGISVGAYPGAAVVVGRKGFAVLEAGFGRLTWGRSALPVVPQRTIYDLASLTKVVGTTTAIMVLYDEGKVGLDDPVVKFIPTFRGGGKERVTVRMLLEHRSGLPPGRDLGKKTHTPEEARARVISTPLSCAPGACYQYSDLGADMLGFIVEAASNQRLDQFLTAKVYEPLGMYDTFFRPADSLHDRIAPTKNTSSNGAPAPGLVHDGNAYALGAIAGHAGLFSTAADLSVFSQMMLNGGQYNGVRVLADSTVRLFTARAPVKGNRALGWDTCNGDYGCGGYLSERAYGHTGFTGTSIWIDPDRQMFMVLLTNRVYEPRVRRPAKVIADVRSDLADASVLAVEDFGDGPLAMPSAFRSDLETDWNRPLRRTIVRRSNKPSVMASKARAPGTKAPAAAGKPAAAVTKSAASDGKPVSVFVTTQTASLLATAGASPARGTTSKK
jgi:CubicO group peptidase (beta-lactamase class C family)